MDCFLEYALPGAVGKLRSHERHAALTTMRIDRETRAIIKEEAARHFGPASEARLFGSRARDESRGGDIDLFIEAEGGLL